MTASAAGMALLLYLSKTGRIPLAWTWLILIGTVSTFAIGYVLGPAFDRERPAAPLEPTATAASAGEG
jgi:hypothetical protein